MSYADKVFIEYEHGDAEYKKVLSSLLELTKAGDTLIATEVSRLARSTKQLCEIIEFVRDQRLRLSIVGSITVDCTAGCIPGRRKPGTSGILQAGCCR